MIANFDRATDGCRQLGREIDLLNLKCAAISLEFDKPAATTAGGGIDIILVRNWRRDVGGAALGRPGVAPQELAGFGVHADDALLEELHVLFHAARVADDNRCVCRFVALRHGALPNHCTALLV